MANRTVTHQEFYRLCEIARNMQERIMRCHRLGQVAALLGDAFGRPLSKHTAGSVIDATSIKLTKSPRPTGERRSRTVMIIARSIASLYEKMGEPIPDDLKCVLLKQSVPDPDPIPASTIIDPKTMRVVNDIKYA